GYFKHDRMLRFLYAETLLGDDRPADDLKCGDVHRFVWAYFLPLSFFAAGFVFEACFFATAAFFFAGGAFAAFAVSAGAASITTTSGTGVGTRGPSVVPNRMAASFESSR